MSADHLVAEEHAHRMRVATIRREERDHIFRSAVLRVLRAIFSIWE